MKQREAQYLIWRAEKQQLIDEYENLQKQVQDDKEWQSKLRGNNEHNLKKIKGARLKKENIRI